MRTLFLNPVASLAGILMLFAPAAGTDAADLVQYAERAPFRVHYMRLTGALGGPLFIQAQSAGGVTFGQRTEVAFLGARDPDDGYTVVLGGKDVGGRRDQVERSVAEFWAHSAFKKAVPLTTELWMEMARSGWAGHRLIAAADRSAQNLYCILSLTTPWLLDADPAIKDRIPDYALGDIYGESVPNYVQEKIDPNAECNEQVANKVGFLFAIVENTGKAELQDVEASYLRLQTGEIDTSRTSQGLNMGADKMVAPETSMNQYHDELLGATSAHPLQNLEPGDAFIWLLSIYRTDDNGFERHFIGAAERPISLNFRLNGVEVTFEIPPPALQDALPIEIPFGWYQS